MASQDMRVIIALTRNIQEATQVLNAAMEAAHTTGMRIHAEVDYQQSIGAAYGCPRVATGTYLDTGKLTWEK